MSRRVLLLLGLACLACSNDCEEARQKLEDCAPEETPASASHSRLPVAISEDCSEDEECLAKCINDHSCAAIRVVVHGAAASTNSPPPDDASELEACLFACAS